MSAPLNNTNTHLPAIEEAKMGIQTLAIYHYQSLRDAGFDEQYAKSQTAYILEEQHRNFLQQAKLPPKSIGTIENKINSVAKVVQEEAKTNFALRKAFEDLLSIQKSLQTMRKE